MKTVADRQASAMARSAQAETVVRHAPASCPASGTAPRRGDARWLEQIHESRMTSSGRGLALRVREVRAMKSLCSIEQRMERAAARWAGAVARVNRAAATVQASEWRVTSSRAVLDWGRRPISGGGDARYDRAVRVRMRALINASLLPLIFSGTTWAEPCVTRHECLVCGIPIEVGEIEYELPFGAVAVFVHRRCYVLWQASGSGDEPA
jgi:hypothetical protein